MCDPLGASQVLPYLFGLAKFGHRISLISFEKRDRTAAERAAVAGACAEAGIDWHPLPYHKRPPVLSSIYDIGGMARLAMRLHRQRHFDLVHCRSDLPALVGLKIKRRFGVPFIFDMRGFWADERVDGRIWNLANPLFRTVFNFFKRREAEFLSEAAHVVTLTRAAERLLMARHQEVHPPITVIPCCADFTLFAPITDEARAAARRQLEIPETATVATYIGSIGTWYLTDQMLDLFRVQLERDPAALFLVLTREAPEKVLAAARSTGIPADRIIVRAATRTEVPRLTAAADYALFFIMPLYSKTASSPTKMGELLALELPMITNGDVGDVTEIMVATGAGTIVDGFDEGSYRKALDSLRRLTPDMAKWRAAARQWFDLDLGVDRYNTIYRSLITAATRPEDEP